jgi:hypothetical protein
MKYLIIIIVITVFAALPISAQADDKKSALGVVEQLFREMAASNPAGILATGTDENQLVAVRRNREGKTVVEVLGGVAFSKLFADRSRGVMREEMYAPQVEVSGDYAMVYGRYVFWVNDKLSHCGLNQFNLVRVDGAWKIANGASTIIPGDCTEKEKAMKPDPAKWPAAKN